MEQDGVKFTKRQYEAGQLLQDALTGDRIAKNKFFEALSTSDLPTALEPSLNVLVKDEYEGIPVIWESFADREIVDDFRLQELAKYGFNTEGIGATNAGQAYVNGTLPRINELGEYPVIGVTGSSVTFRLAKSGVKFELSWERIINDRSLSEIQRAWRRFARMARQTEEVEATKQFVTASGLNTTNLTDGSGSTNDCLLAGNPVLSSTALENAYKQAVQHTVDGHRAVMPVQFNLMVPSALEFTAKKILAENSYGTNPSAGTTEYFGPNPLAGKFDLVVNDWISTLYSANGLTTWGIMPKPGDMEDGGAALAFLRGNENPQFFVRSTTLQSPEDGDYDHDAYSTKVRHTATGLFRENNAGIVFSTGAGS